MTGEEALQIVDAVLRSTILEQGLNDVQSVVFIESWLGRTYAEIADKLGYDYDYIKQVGSQLWRSLSQVTGEEVSKKISKPFCIAISNPKALHKIGEKPSMFLDFTVVKQNCKL